MSTLKVRIPVSPVVLMTFMAAAILLYSVYLIVPESGRIIVMACAGIMLVVVAFTSMELALGTLCGLGGLTIHAIGSNIFVIVRIMEPLMILVGLSLAALLIEQQKDDNALQREKQTYAEAGR